MFQKPRSAKRLHWDVIPRAVDEYHQHLRAYAGQELAQQLQNPAWHIHDGNPPESDMEVPFSMLLNLASAASAEDKEQLWGFIRRYAPDATPQNHPGLDAAAGHAVRYFQDHVKPTKTFREPTEKERAALADLRDRLAAWDPVPRMPRNCRTWSSPSETSMASSRCATGSRRSTRCCWAPRRARVSAVSSRCTASPRPWH